MAQIVVRDLEDAVKEALKRRAHRHGRSMEDEVRHILRSAVKEERRAVRKLGSRISQRFQKVGLPSELPEWGGEQARAADFDK